MGGLQGDVPGDVRAVLTTKWRYPPVRVEGFETLGLRDPPNRAQIAAADIQPSRPCRI